MATPANWDQFNEDMRQWQEQAQDLARTYRGLVDVAASGELGALAFIESLSEAPIGDLSALLQALTLQNVAGRETVGSGPEIMRRGAYGLGGVQTSFAAHFNDYTTPGFTAFEALASNTTNGPTESAYGSLLVYRRQASDRVMQEFNSIIGSGARYLRFASRGEWTPWVQVLTTGNTTTDSNGFIKTASPIFRLSNTAEAARADGLNFVDAGAGAANNEAPGVTATHDDVGVYTIHGSLGFATEGWAVEIPLDINGNRMVFVKTEQSDDGTITVRTFKPKPDLETLTFIAGEPVDIPEGRWIDLRLSMPEPEKTEPTDAA